MAIGYALGNSIMIDAPEGLIIVDVTETVESGRQIFAEFRKISKKPVKAIVYTHQHPDHTWGAKVHIVKYLNESRQKETYFLHVRKQAHAQVDLRF